MKNLIRSLIHGFGYDIVERKRSKSEQLSKFLQTTEINIVFDVGANIGQFASDLRSSGYYGTIHSFEPLEDQFCKLLSNASNDENWICYNFAFGDEAGNKEIHVANNNHSSASSFLEFSGFSREVIDVEMTHKLLVEIKTIENFIASLDEIQFGSALLKLDVQGFETAVLIGAGDALSRFPAILLEASFFKIYKDEKLIGDLISMLEEKGYRPVAFFVEMESNIGTTLQSDVLFVSEELHTKLELLHRQPNLC